MPLENYKIYTIEELEILNNEFFFKKLINKEEEMIENLKVELNNFRKQKKWFNFFSNINQKIKTLEIEIAKQQQELKKNEKEYENFKISSVEKLEEDLRISKEDLYQQRLKHNPFYDYVLEEFNNNCEENKENERLNQQLKKSENEYQNLKNKKDQLEEKEKELAAELKTTSFFLFWKKWKIKKEININNQEIKANDQKIIENEDKIKKNKYKKYAVLLKIISIVKDIYKNNLSYLNEKQNEKIDTLTDENMELQNELLAFKEKKTNEPLLEKMPTAKDQEIFNSLEDKNPEKSTNPFNEDEIDNEKKSDFIETANNHNLNIHANSEKVQAAKL